MSQWFRMYAEVLDDPKVQRLAGEEFKAALLAAMAGEETAFSPFVAGPFHRPLAHEWAVIRAEVFARDDYTCTYCGAHGVQLECDHVVPVARGGSSDLGNLTTSCRPCNRSKRDKLVEEWMA
ncbi:HNH endonuclease [Sphingobium xenophagum]|nr:HNH endonuclease [Sphingobium xenophagum]